MSRARPDEEDEDECFHDSLDRLLSSANTSCSSSALPSDDEDDPNSRLGSPNYDPLIVPRFPAANNYDVWISQPSSVEERRLRLLRQMGLSCDPSLLRRRPPPSAAADGTENFGRSVLSDQLKCASGSGEGFTYTDKNKNNYNSNSNSINNSANANECTSVSGIVRSKSDGDCNSSRYSTCSSSSVHRNSEFLSIDSAPLSSASAKEANVGGSIVVNNSQNRRRSASNADQLRNCNGSLPTNPLSPKKPPTSKHKSNSLQNGSCNFGHGEAEEVLRVEEAAVCTIKDLDNGKEFVVNEVREDGMWNKLKEVGTGRQLTMEEFEMCVGTSPIVQELMRRQNVEDGNKDGLDSNANDSSGSGSKLKKRGGWLKSIRNVANSMTGYKERRSSDERDTSSEKGGRRSSSATDDSQDASFHGPERVRVRQYGKSCKELSALYKTQEIQAHNGSIWTIKFSLDGKYLGSAGEDCAIHVWQVTELERKGDMLLDKPDDGSLNVIVLTNGSSEPISGSPSLDGHTEKKRSGKSSINRKSVSFDSKVPAIATASLNLAEYASSANEKDVEISVPLEVSSSLCIQSSPVLCLSLNLVELRNVHEASSETTQKPGEVLHEKIAASPLRAGLEKVKIFKGLSSRGHKKTCHEDEGSDSRSPVRSEDTEYSYPVDTDSFGDSEEGESEEGAEDSNMRKSFSYEALAYANHAGGSYYSNTSGSEDEDLIYYSHQKSDPEDATRSALDQSMRQSSKRGILPWGKRRLSFKSPKSKGEPLLKKHYGEEGGDDIDFDRRQLSSSDESSTGKTGKGSTEARSPVSEFGDDNFAVGSWESKEIVSRDGEMKLQTQVFFASIDQRDEQAAGESACTALVAVIADWFHINREELPIKSQLDSLIREGSLEWRSLCENESYRERFPDKHFDLETVLQAKVRPLSVSQEKSFIGFFHPEGIEDEGFDFLKGAMSFDNIWDEISKPCLHASGGDSLVYIVSWNDHFFVLKVEQDAYYIIDTLGERLYEGCNQAYILKFDRDTTISRLAKETEEAAQDKPGSDKTEQNDTKEAASEGKTTVSTSTSATDKEEGESTNDEEPKESEQEAIMCRGREACKEYIKSFLAAIPIRELQVDLKKGLMASTPLHQRLQIEFHYTKRSPELPSSVHLTANPSEAQSVLAE